MKERHGLTQIAEVVAIAAMIALRAATAHAATPDEEAEQHVRQLMAAADRADMESFLAGLSDAARVAFQRSFDEQRALDRANQDFVGALDERFGKGGRVLSDELITWKATLARFAHAEIVGTKARDDGSIEVHVRARKADGSGKRAVGEGLLLVQKENGQWKLALESANSGPQTASHRETVLRFVREVQQGKYPDRSAAMLALGNALTHESAGAK